MINLIRHLMVNLVVTQMVNLICFQQQQPVASGNASMTIVVVASVSVVVLPTRNSYKLQFIYSTAHGFRFRQKV